jgi:hypothetical protein
MGAELSGPGYVHRPDRHNAASAKVREVNYAEEENNTGTSVISHHRHAD